MKTKLLKRLRKEAILNHNDYRICPICGRMWHKSEMWSSTPCCGAWAYIARPDEYILLCVAELKGKRR